MTIDWANFTPWEATIGGAILGVSAMLLLLFGGRIFGCAGIIGGMLSPSKGNFGWRLSALTGLFVGGYLTSIFIMPDKVENYMVLPTSFAIIGGVIVGFGTRMGNGCTTGHGICGISRLSMRSIAATGTFMCTAFITVFVMKQFNLFG